VAAVFRATPPWLAAVGIAQQPLAKEQSLLEYRNGGKMGDLPRVSDRENVPRAPASDH